jgi:hypothetical protein
MNRTRIVCVTLLVGALALSACSKDDKNANSNGSTTSRASTSSTTAAADGTTTTTSGGSTVTTGGTASHQQPPVGVGEAAPLAENFLVTITRVDHKNLTGEGPGDTSGPGVVATIEVRNNTSAPIDLSKIAVNAHYGDSIPAVPSHIPESGFNGTLEPGKSKTGTYAFRVPEGQDNVVFDIQHSGAPNIVLVDASK